ncbi:MAG: hypothetical protein A3C11_02885 [Candidatus Sungbacteria bacterium RIFCSPHIGHO2_02_FULL_49_12]|uniref:YggT family protein n=1 Tax=Candidatus Sungbacteria bacterium RIFCSPHIGHO2_02_FULL_49_12 TaxID=1802271 RepID=A0A1G2KQ48_9BACT|nr:MAG: hypothetical protein A3C11_02885 [Candidatus Sungbacteria bacterium RIFCSPHIGHO2_02_FULL_49_12]
MTTYQFQDALWAIYRWVYKAVHRAILIVFWLAEFLLFIRLLLVFFRANPEALVVNQLYWLTGRLIQPFQRIFPDYIWRDRHIELTTASAMAGYLIVMTILLILLRLFHRNRTAASMLPPVQYH